MYNICRAFTLYNDSALPGNTEANQGEYVSFGYYDGISVSRNLFEEVNGKYTFSFLWKYCDDISNKADGTYLSQIVYAFRTDENEEYEADFWKNDDSEYPFMFFSFVQLKNKKHDSLKKLSEFEAALNEINSSRKCQIITYLTLDSSDLILIIRCGEYETGAEIIDDFHSSQENNLFEEYMGCNIGYCYTVASIDRAFLNCKDKVKTLTGEIANVQIYMIEQMPKSIQAIYDELKDTINTYGIIKPAGMPVLGCNDEVLLLENIPWNKFLIHYMDKTGCLNHSSKIYADNLVEVTTIIGSRRKNQNPGNVEKSSNNKIHFGVCEKLLNNFRSVAEYYPNIRKSVTQILCSLRKFENEHFPPYLYSSLIHSVDMMIDILQEAATNGLKDNAAEYFFQCQKAFYLSIQNTARVDRQFTQTPDFDMRMYDVPVKLVMFFIAYINAIKEYLSKAGEMNEEEAHKYEFLLCPGGAYSTQVTELFQLISEKNRMFLVEIPEHQIYNIKLMLIMLGHEVAHIVGKEIRNRNGRMEKAIGITAKLAVSYMKNALETWKNHKWEECIAYVCSSTTVWEEIENQITDGLKKFLDEDYLKRYLKEEYHDNGKRTAMGDKIERLIKRKEYSAELSYLLAKGLQQFMENESDKLWERIKYRCKNYLNATDKSDFQASQYQLQEKMHEITRKIVIGDQIDAEVFSAINTIGMMMNVFSESFADLAVVQITGMPWQDYIGAAITCQKQQNFRFDTTKDSEWLLRMGLVVACMDYPENGSEFGEWNIQEFENDNILKEEKKVKIALYNFVKTYFYEGEKTDSESLNGSRPREIISGLSVLYDAGILREMLKYLMDCKCKLKEAGNDKSETLDMIRKMYQLFGKNCKVHDELLKMQEYIDAYVSNIPKEGECEDGRTE